MRPKRFMSSNSNRSIEGETNSERSTGIPTQMRTGTAQLLQPESGEIDANSREGKMIKALLLVYMRRAVEDAAVYAHVAGREMVTTRDVVLAMRNLALPRSNFWETANLEEMVRDAADDWDGTRSDSTVDTDEGSADDLEGQTVFRTEDDCVSNGDMAQRDASDIIDRVGVAVNEAGDEECEWTMASATSPHYPAHASLIIAMNSADNEWSEWTPTNNLDQLIVNGINAMER